MAKIIDGKEISAQLKDELKERVAQAKGGRERDYPGRCAGWQ